MKIILEDSTNEEIEIIIKGNVASTKVQHLLSLLKQSNVSTKIIVFEDSKEILINVSEIHYFSVESRKIYGIIGKNKYLCKQNLSDILSLFKNQGICQISKSLLVNINFVKSLEAEFSGNYTVMLKDGSKLTASRFYMKEFRNAIMES